MGIAALILGIVSLIVAFIPFCGIIAFFPAVIGLILGIVDVVLKSKKNEKKGTGIAGIVLCSIAVVVMILWFFVFGVAFAEAVQDIDWNNLATELNQRYDSESNY